MFCFYFIVLLKNCFSSKNEQIYLQESPRYCIDHPDQSQPASSCLRSVN